MLFGTTELRQIDASRDLVRRLDLERAAAEALARPGDFFPSHIAFQAANSAADFVKTFRTQLSRGTDLRSADLVAVPRWGGGFRPASDLGIRERLLYDALVRLLADELPDGIVNWSPVGAARLE